jgi:DNA-binding response OmpR family regulator
MSQRVLIVDDEPDLREVIDYNLRAAGYEVSHAESGTTALASAQRHLPDAIVLDINLPGLDGLAVCEMLRLLPSTRDIPILMLTALATDQTRKLGLQVGASDYMTKPFSPRELVARVGKLVVEPHRSEQGNAPAS